MKNTAPSTLSARSKAWFQEIDKDYALEPHHLRLLEAACQSWDRAEEAKERIDADGAYLVTKTGNLKEHPALKIEIANRTLFVRIVRELALDTPAPGTRPPRGR